MKNRIRLLVVDDHPVVRKCVNMRLARHQQIEVVGEAADGREAICRARELKPDIALMDIDMPHFDGLAAAKVLQHEFPKIKVLILSTQSSSAFVLRIIQSGARGFVLKEALIDELVRAIETVNAGEAYFSADVARVALNQLVRNRREATVAPQRTSRER
jgi:DNA-binding NarL/FixJ family response regulator